MIGHFDACDYQLVCVAIDIYQLLGVGAGVEITQV